MFTINIDTDGAAFRDEGKLDMTAWEIRRLLESVEERLENGQNSGILIDVYGNKCGQWDYKED